MKITVSSSMVKIFSLEDCIPISGGKCAGNEGYAFQLYVQSDTDVCFPVSVQADVETAVYEVKKIKGDYYIDKEVDDYYVYAEDHYYPELLRAVDKVCLKAGGAVTLFVEITEKQKTAGVHTITVCLGEERVQFPLTVVGNLTDSDLNIVHWTHMDGICHYYKVEPFSDEFYKYFRSLVASYAKMGNTVMFVPMFTPPLDTEVGKERRTTQLMGVKVVGENQYEFDFSKAEYYINLCKEYGLKKFLFSHLFTQWGGEFCPKIMADVNGEEKRIFGWDVSSESEEYKAFLAQYLPAWVAFLDKMGIRENSTMSLTDEPHGDHIQTYVRLAEFVKKYNGGVKTSDALSNYSFAETGAVDLPVVCTGSYEFDKFYSMDRMLYYCVGVDGNYLSNRYFHMPMQRTQILGFQLYETQCQGFLHWGYNFYNTMLSKREINPYEETTAGGGFVAGDSFIVYPGENGVEYSIRFFAMMKAFDDYKLLKTLEGKLGKDKVMELLHAEGVRGVHEYPRSAVWHETFREKLLSLL